MTDITAKHELGHVYSSCVKTLPSLHSKKGSDVAVPPTPIVLLYFASNDIQSLFCKWATVGINGLVGPEDMFGTCASVHGEVAGHLLADCE